MKFNKQQWEWIFYDWANSGYAMLITTAVFPIYFKAVALQGGISSADSTAYWGYANSFSTLIIALLAPLLGALADYPHAKRRWLNIFTWLGIVTAMILGSLPANGTLAWLWLIIVYVISNMGYSGSNLFYDSFLTDVADDEQMDEISSAGFGFGYLGGVLSFAVFLVAELTNGFSILDGNGVARFSFWLSAGWWLLFAWPLMKNGQQRYGVPDTENRIANSWQRVLQTLRHINHYRQAFWFLVAYFFFIDGVDTIVTMAMVIGEDLGIKTTTLMIVMLIVQLIAAPFSMLYAWLAKKTSTRRALLLSIIVYMLICLYALKLKSAADFWVLAILVGTSQGGIQALSRSYFGRLIPKSDSSEFFDFYNILGKFSAILGPVLVGLATQWTGNSRWGIFSLVILFVIGLVIFLILPRLNDVKPE